MATKYEDIYDAFLNKISDYELPLLDSVTSEDMIRGYLKNAIARSGRILKHIDFSNTTNISPSESCVDHTCHECNLNQDNAFVDDLIPEDIDVLTEWMIVFWLEPYVNNGELLQTALNTKDFKIAFSPGNLLEKISARHELSRKHALSLMKLYSFIYSDIERLKP